jgi:uncharacterized protein YprB with RNaseH-like and TPR domain
MFVPRFTKLTMPSLSDKLKSLGVKLGARDLPPPQPRRQAHAVEHVIPGRFQPTPQGEIFVVETLYSPEYRHGRAGLQLSAVPQTIARWANDTRIATCPPTSFAFLDTETTGLAGGTGTYAFLIGVGRYEGEEFCLAQFFMRDPLEEPAQLAALAEFLQPCQMLVTFNGKAFDVPLLNSRYITNGGASPLFTPAHLDLLPLARRLWRERLPSRALGQLELHILGATRTQEDVPGWQIPGVYFDYLRSGDARPLKGIFYHNAMDVLAMAGLLNHMTRLLDDPLDGRVKHGLDLVALGKLFETLGYFETAVQLYRQGLAQELPEESYWDALRRLSFVQKRQNNWPAAIELWQQAAAGRQIYAHIELAKFYEHRAHDYHQAKHWTQAALTLIAAPNFPRSKRRRWRLDLEHRLARLQRRLS